MFDYHSLAMADEDYLKSAYQQLWDIRKAIPAKNEKWGTSRHHFLPKAFGGGDDANNYIRITNEEHFVAHYILHKLHGGKMTSAFAFVAGGLFHRDEIQNENLKMMSELFASQESTIRKNNSERMKGEGNPCYGLTGSNHPTSSFDKSGKNNPNYGKTTTDKCKQKTREANKGKVTVRFQDGTTGRVTKEQFESDDTLVSTMQGKSSPKVKNTVSCFDLRDGKCKRVPSDVYYNYEYYTTAWSKKAKEYKKQKAEYEKNK